MRKALPGVKAASLVAGLLALLAAGVVHADTIQVTSTYYSGSRTWPSSSPGGITFIDKDPSITDPTSITLSWTIVESNGYFTYTYKASNGGNGSLSHFDIEVSTGFGTSDILTGSSGSITLGDPTWSNPSGGNPPGYNNSAPVLKFPGSGASTEQTFVLVTTRVPVWGDFLIKDGSWDAYNTGFGTDPTGTSYTDWIPTPDTATIPLPPAALAGLGLLALLGGVRAARRRKKD